MPLYRQSTKLTLSPPIDIYGWLTKAMRSLPFRAPRPVLVIHVLEKYYRENADIDCSSIIATPAGEPVEIRPVLHLAIPDYLADWLDGLSSGHALHDIILRLIDDAIRRGMVIDGAEYRKFIDERSKRPYYTPGEKKAYNKVYTAAHAEEQKVRNAKYRETPEKRRAYIEANREKINEYQRAWVDENREHYRAYHRAYWHKQNDENTPEAAAKKEAKRAYGREYQKRRKAAKLAAQQAEQAAKDDG